MADFDAWLREAKADLDRAQAALNRNDESYALVHAHQSVEKAPKGMQVEAWNTYDRGHNLVELSRDLRVPSRFDRICEDLTPTYTAARYPDMPDPDIDDPSRLVEKTDEFLTWVQTEWHATEE